MSKKLIQQGVDKLGAETAQRASRVPRAADANRDPALPAQAQPAATPPAPPAPALVPEEFGFDRLDGLDVEQQIQLLEEEFRAADRIELESFQLAKMRGSVRKGELLALLLEHRAPESRGLTVGDYAETLGVKRQYVYELIGGAGNIRDLAPLIEETATPLVASQAAVLAPIYRRDPKAAARVLERAKATGKLSAASLTAAAEALELELPAKSRQAAEAAPHPTPVARLALADVFKSLAPKRVDELVRVDPAAVLARVGEVEQEVARVQRRLDAAKKAARKALDAS